MYLKIVDQVINPEVKTVNQVAYLTVLISLTQSVADSKGTWKPFVKLTLENNVICDKLHSIISLATEGDTPSLTQIYKVRFEKILYLYCALKDLQGKCEQGQTTFASE